MHSGKIGETALVLKTYMFNVFGCMWNTMCQNWDINNTNVFLISSNICTGHRGCTEAHRLYSYQLQGDYLFELFISS